MLVRPLEGIGNARCSPQRIAFEISHEPGVDRSIEHPVALAVEREEDERHVELIEEAFADEALVERFAGRAERVDEHRHRLARAPAGAM